MRTSMVKLATVVAVCLGTLCLSQPAVGIGIKDLDPTNKDSAVRKGADKVKEEAKKKKKEAERAANKAREKAERIAKAKKEEAERIAKAKKDEAERAARKAHDDAQQAALKAREDVKQAALKAREDAKREALRKRDELLAEAWGEAGRAAYPAGAAIMAARYNGRAEQMLPRHDRAVLKKHFGDCVDKVRIVWGALPLNEWKAAGKSIHLGGEAAEAQTYGYSIYVRPKLAALSDEARLTLLIHELAHVRQYEKYGNSLSNFGYHYFKRYKLAGENYEKNSMEESAERTVARLTSQVLVDYRARTAGTAGPVWPVK